ncbi:MAG: cytochrome c oxidase assembly protein [Bradyrhizobiaceae bacterium]|nr:cytochrome c oxidase assembly protein [Bradyrhizobiaceae bacterium]
MSGTRDSDRDAARAEGRELARRHVRVAAACAVFVAAMVGAAYAAVPLYDWFCRTTGFGGRPLVAKTAPDKASDRRITVRFDANVAGGLPWDFAPEIREVEIAIGETRLVNYAARNRAPSAAAGTATYNVSPPQAGAYFNKMQCFCFTEQKLAGGERMEMPVAFFVDPAILQDPELKSLKSITLSYTFFPVRQGAEPVAARGDGKAPM